MSWYLESQWSLNGVTLCQKCFKIFIWENVCITRKTKFMRNASESN